MLRGAGRGGDVRERKFLDLGQKMDFGRHLFHKRNGQCVKLQANPNGMTYLELWRFCWKPIHLGETDSPFDERT